MSWKKTLNDPQKMMEYRRPVFMLGVGLAYFSAKMKQQVAPQLLTGYISQMGSMYSSMVPSVKQLIKPTFPTGLTSMPGITNTSINAGTGDENWWQDPSGGPPSGSGQGKAASPIIKQVNAVKRYIKRQTKPGSQTKAAVRWVGRKLGLKPKKKKKGKK